MYSIIASCPLLDRSNSFNDNKIFTTNRGIKCKYYISLVVTFPRFTRPF